jgi:uncharacterized protein with ParB-like and HNH nuclease domain
MDAKPLSLGKIVSERQRFVVPIYQRTYSWTVKEQLQALFDQIEDKTVERLANGKVEFAHYMGALLLIPESDPVFGRIQTFDIVDGQQRLTTFHLCFAALRDVARHYGIEGIASQLSDLVVHSDAVPMEDRKTERYKLQPSSYDRALFRDLVDLSWRELIKKYPNHFYKNETIRKTAPLPLLAYWHFWKQADAFITQDGKDKELSGIQKRLLALSTVLFEDFRLIVITLAKDDDAQVIFQTLNSGGKPLAAMDLVRNDVFHRAARAAEDEEALMDNHWAIFEQPFWKMEQTQGRIKKPRIDFYLAHTLAAEQGKLISLAELYSEYKGFVGTQKFPSSTAELTLLTRHVSTYRSLVEPAGEGALARLAKRLSVFDVSTAYPAIFVIAGADVDDPVKDQLYEFIAGYVVRRALCNLTPKNYNNVFVELAAHLTSHRVSVAAFSSYFAAKDAISTARFPTDSDVRTALRTRPQYNWIPQNRLRLILEELEFASRNKFNVNGTLQEDLSIEHIMPQEWPAHWPLPSGQVAPRDKQSGVDEALRTEIDTRDSLIHSLGNLTLLTPPANTSAGNAGFEVKRVRLHDSLLNTNSAILKEPTWDEAAILRRADVLALLAYKLWPSPT